MIKLEPVSGSERTRGRRGTPGSARSRGNSWWKNATCCGPARTAYRAATARTSGPARHGIPGSTDGEPHEAAHQQARAGKQDDRQRHLDDDQRARSRAPPRLVSAPRPPSFSDAGTAPRVDWNAGTMPKSEPGKHDEADGEQDHRAVDRDLVEPRNPLRLQRRSGTRRPRRASSRPRRAAGGARMTLSVSSWRTSRPRPAPSAAADRHLALARRGARQQQVRHVRAGDQQHEARPRRAARAPPCGCRRPSPLQRHRRHADAGVRRPDTALASCVADRLALRRPPAASVTPGLARPTAVRYQCAALLGGERSRVLERRPQGARRPDTRTPAASRRRLASTTPSSVIVCPTIARVAAEPLLPQSVTEDGNLVPARQIFVGRERPDPDVAGHAKHVEESGADVGGVETDRLTLAGEDDARARERRASASVWLILRRSVKFGPDIEARCPSERWCSPTSRSGSAYGSGLRSTAVDDAEDRAVGADAERQRDHRDDAEPGAPQQVPPCVLDVLAQRVHELSRQPKPCRVSTGHSQAGSRNVFGVRSRMQGRRTCPSST